MKISITLFLLFIFSFFQVRAQFISPNNGQSYNFNDLVNISSGAVTAAPYGFDINSDITISANDSLVILQSAILKFGPGVLFTSLGYLEINAQNGVGFIDCFPLVPGQFYKGWRIENNSNSVVNRLLLDSAGGMRILNADITLQSCIFLNSDKSNSTGVVNLFQSSPTIRNCHFLNNQGPAINSGANVFSAPKIFNSLFIHNNSDNTNSPQINLGPSGSTDTIIIKGNQIIGLHDNAGGISTSNLLGAGFQNVLIDSNFIENNRYGITCTGNNINARITRNTILNNDIQNSPNLGGSGININGGSTNTSVIGENKIAGNLWGVTIQGTAQVNLGDSIEASSGYNCFSNNGNSGTIYALYNNTPSSLSAQFNDWDNSNPENVIFHLADDPSLGMVNFSPFETGLDSISADFDFIIINDTVYLTNLSIGDSLDVYWELGNLMTSNSNDPFFVLSPLQTQSQVSLRIRGACSEREINKQVFSYCGFDVSYPALNFNMDSMTKTVSFSTSITSDTISYLWTFGDGNTSMDKDPIYQYDSAGVYFVDLIAFNNCGDTIKKEILVQIPFIGSMVEKTFSPMRIYPNPATSQIEYEYSEIITEILLYNTYGDVVLIKKSNSNSGTINFDQLENGIYFLRLKSKSGAVIRKSLIKQN